MFSLEYDKFGRPLRDASAGKETKAQSPRLHNALRPDSEGEGSLTTTVIQQPAYGSSARSVPRFLDDFTSIGRLENVAKDSRRSTGKSQVCKDADKTKKQQRPENVTSEQPSSADQAIDDSAFLQGRFVDIVDQASKNKLSSHLNWLDVNNPHRRFCSNAINKRLPFLLPGKRERNTLAREHSFKSPWKNVIVDYNKNVKEQKSKSSKQPSRASAEKKTKEKLTLGNGPNTHTTLNETLKCTRESRLTSPERKRVNNAEIEDRMLPGATCKLETRSLADGVCELKHHDPISHSGRHRNSQNANSNQKKETTSDNKFRQLTEHMMHHQEGDGVGKEGLPPANKKVSASQDKKELSSVNYPQNIQVYRVGNSPLRAKRSKKDSGSDRDSGVSVTESDASDVSATSMKRARRRRTPRRGKEESAQRRRPKRQDSFHSDSKEISAVDYEKERPKQGRSSGRHRHMKGGTEITMFRKEHTSYPIETKDDRIKELERKRRLRGKTVRASVDRGSTLGKDHQKHLDDAKVDDNKTSKRRNNEPEASGRDPDDKTVSRRRASSARSEKEDERSVRSAKEDERSVKEDERSVKEDERSVRSAKEDERSVKEDERTVRSAFDGRRRGSAASSDGQKHGEADRHSSSESDEELTSSEDEDEEDIGRYETRRNSARNEVEEPQGENYRQRRYSRGVERTASPDDSARGKDDARRAAKVSARRGSNESLRRERRVLIDPARARTEARERAEARADMDGFRGLRSAANEPKEVRRHAESRNSPMKRAGSLIRFESADEESDASEEDTRPRKESDRNHESSRRNSIESKTAERARRKHGSDRRYHADHADRHYHANHADHADYRRHHADHANYRRHHADHTDRHYHANHADNANYRRHHADQEAHADYRRHHAHRHNRADHVDRRTGRYEDHSTDDPRRRRRRSTHFEDDADEPASQRSSIDSTVSVKPASYNSSGRASADSEYIDRKERNRDAGERRQSLDSETGYGVSAESSRLTEVADRKGSDKSKDVSPEIPTSGKSTKPPEQDSIGTVSPERKVSKTRQMLETAYSIGKNPIQAIRIRRQAAKSAKTDGASKDGNKATGSGHNSKVKQTSATTVENYHAVSVQTSPFNDVASRGASLRLPSSHVIVNRGVLDSAPSRYGAHIRDRIDARSTIICGDEEGVIDIRDKKLKQCFCGQTNRKSANKVDGLELLCACKDDRCHCSPASKQEVRSTSVPKQMCPRTSSCDKRSAAPRSSYSPQRPCERRTGDPAASVILVRSGKYVKVDVSTDKANRRPGGYWAEDASAKPRVSGKHRSGSHRDGLGSSSTDLPVFRQGSSNSMMGFDPEYGPVDKRYNIGSTRHGGDKSGKYGGKAGGRDEDGQYAKALGRHGMARSGRGGEYDDDPWAAKGGREGKSRSGAGEDDDPLNVRGGRGGKTVNGLNGEHDDPRKSTGGRDGKFRNGKGGEEDQRSSRGRRGEKLGNGLDVEDDDPKSSRGGRNGKSRNGKGEDDDDSRNTTGGRGRQSRYGVTGEHDALSKSRRGRGGKSENEMVGEDEDPRNSRGRGGRGGISGSRMAGEDDDPMHSREGRGGTSGSGMGEEDDDPRDRNSKSGEVGVSDNDPFAKNKKGVKSRRESEKSSGSEIETEKSRQRTRGKMPDKSDAEIQAEMKSAKKSNVDSSTGTDAAKGKQKVKMRKESPGRRRKRSKKVHQEGGLYQGLILHSSEEGPSIVMNRGYR